MNYKRLLFIFLLLFTFCSINTACFSSNIIKNSSGRVTFHFRSVPIQFYDLQMQLQGSPHTFPEYTKTCNGFLLKRNNRVYCITTLHTSKIFNDGTEYPREDRNGVHIGYYKYLENDNSYAFSIEIPNKISEDNIPKTDRNFFDGDTIAKEPQESVDIACIDVTTYIDGGTEQSIIYYNMLADTAKGTEIENNNNNKLCGYPANQLENIMDQYYKEEPIPPNIHFYNNFGDMVIFNNGERMHGFVYDLDTQRGDSGRPIIAKLSSSNMVIGMNRFSYGPGRSIAIDSTSIKRTIDAFYDRFK